MRAFARVALVLPLATVACVSSEIGNPPGGGGAGASATGAGGTTMGGTGTSGSGGASGAAGAPAGGGMPENTSFASGVRVHLQRTYGAPKLVSFGLPVPPGAVKNASDVRFSVSGAATTASVKALLAEHDANGAPIGVRALLVQLPATILAGDSADVDVTWSGGAGAAASGAMTLFASADVSADAPEVVPTATRSITSMGGTNLLVASTPVMRTLFTGHEPRVLATFPDGYLAATGLLGHQVTDGAAAAPDSAGLSFLSDQVKRFGASAMYAEDYPVNPDSIVDPVVNYEGWLYDRCATFLTFYTHTGDARFLRHAYRSCSYYASKIVLAGANAGTFSGKPDPDSKYSHLRGLYAYYALTGDESALAAGQAIAALWLQDDTFVGPYRMGHLRGVDKLWTERLLGTSLEGLYYGHRLTGDVQYLAAFKQMLDTATRHITGDAAALASINPGVGPFPPQNCFIHSALQHDEGAATDPWCSIWMSELTIDSLLQYQAQTKDPRVDEIFVRLVRFLRDVGSQYVVADVEGDSFLNPKSCYDPTAGNVRRLSPLYGSGLDAAQMRHNFGLSDDVEHCTDATALTAAGIRALVRQGKFADNPIGPFASEGESFVALHHEFAACAKQTFADWTRPHRDPATWTSADLARGLADPAKFVSDNLIGYPKYVSTPQRKLSWWFNMSMLQFGLLADAGVKIPALQPGRIQPAGCK
ncbi:MAG TPA: hypothetical protein VMU50_16980 [Polyangia bacterium]|nr:hypothetical protein [Polyangia bacterium]